MMAVVFLLFCGENAYSNLYDMVSEKMYRLYFHSTYDTEEMESYFDELFKRYGVSGFYDIIEDADTQKNIWVCTNSDEEKIKDILHIDSCTFNTVMSGRHSLVITDKSRLENEVSREYMMFEIYFYADKGTADEMCDEISQKYGFELTPPQKAENNTAVIWIVCASLVLLLSIYDVFECKKEVCIKLTLGRSLTKQIAVMVLKDTLVFALTALAAGLIMFRVTAVILIIKTYLLFVLSICLLNALLLMSLYLADICSTLKNENGSAGYLHINYILKIAASAALIFMFSLTGMLKEQLAEHECAEEFGDAYSNASYVSMYESPLWSSLIDHADEMSAYDPANDTSRQLMRKNKEDYDRLIRLLDEKYGVFFMGDLNYYTEKYPFIGKSYNVLLATDMMGGYIEKQTGEAPAADGVTVYLPRRFREGQLEIVKDWLNYYGRSYDLTATWKSYDSAVFMGADIFTDERLITTLPMNVAESPVIVYVPHSADFDYFGRHCFFVAADRKAAEAQRRSSMIVSVMTESVPVSSIARDYVRKTSSVTVLFVLTVISMAVYYFAIVISTLTIDINVKKRDRAVCRILGRSAAKRYIGLMLSFVLTLAAGAAGAYLLKGSSKLSSDRMLLTAAAVMLAAEMLAVIIAAKYDEKHNTLRELKGGAL